MMNHPPADTPFDSVAVLPVAFTESSWHGWRCLDFLHHGRAAKLVLPRRAAPGRPWAWRAEFFDHEPQADLSLLDHGFHVAFCDVFGLMGAPAAMAIWEGFYRLLVEAGLDRRAAMIGISRGGLYCYNWAVRHPEAVSCIYGDAPVCDMRSWPGARGKSVAEGSAEDWRAVLGHYGFADDQEAIAWKGNPVDSLAPLAAAGIPLLHVVGDADTAVPVSENTAIVEARYRALGGRIVVIHKPGVGHHPHSLPDPKPIVDFILEATSKRPGRGFPA